MAQGLFTLRQQVQGIVQKAWNTPVGTYAGSFNGSSQYLSLPSIAAYTLSADFTIEFWVNATSYSSTGGGSPTVLSGTNTLNNWLVLVDSGTIAFYWNQTEIVSGGTTNIVGSWFHVAVVRSGSTVTIYKNGTRLNSATNASSFTLTSPLFIGQQNTGVGYWAGLISNVRIVKGTAVYTQNFAPLTTPLAAITNTSLLTLQNATIIDNSTNAATITNGGSVTTGAAMPFTQLKTPAVDYLVVAGGGGGGGQAGSGGGAGGLLQGTVPITAGSSITVTVGTGGGGASGQGGTGVNSVFGSISASGGGGGNSYGTGPTAVSGGSGAGGNLTSGDAAGFGGQGVAGQGNRGGTSGTRNGQAVGAGGGGAGTVGLDTVPASGIPGNGGAGISSAISGTVTAYAGGGGGSGTGTAAGGTGGAGGGGAGAACGSGGVNGSAATPNTGGGGGGGSFGAGVGGNGGSGIVIVSYPDIYAGAAATTGSPTVSTSGSGSMYFNGSTYLVGPTTSALNFSTGNYTVEFWVYPTATPGTLDIYFSASAGGNNFQIGFSPSQYLYSNFPSIRSGTATSIILNKWNHVALVRSGTNVALFSNGTRVGTATDATSTSLTNYYIATYNAGPGNYNATNAYMSNLRLSNAATYDPTLTTYTVPTTPFSPISSTVLLMSTVSGSFLADSSASSLTLSSTTGSPTWNQASPFATGLGYKNRVYTYTGSGTITF